MLKKKFLLLAILLVSLLCLSAVSAAEDITSDIATANDNLILKESINEDAIANTNEENNSDTAILNSASEEDLSEGEGTALSFSNLNNIVNGNQNSTIYLSNNYTYNPSSDGFYIEGIDIKRNLTIYGNGITIDGNNEASAFDIGDSSKIYTITIHDITFINCKRGSGGAINSYNANSTVINCTFKNNSAVRTDDSASYGGALNGVNAIDSTFINNRALKNNGGAMYKGNATNCIFINNSATQTGGALYYSNATNCTFINNKVSLSENVVTYRGGAMLFGTAVDCNFINNSARYGGAISQANAINCNFTGNYAEANGGAIFNSNATGCLFINNSASTAGGASFNSSVKNSSFSDNKAGHRGGAMQDGGAENCNFTNNSATAQGGAVNNATAINCTFIENKCSGTGYTIGGAICNGNATNCTFIKNSAKYGGAAYVTNVNNCNFTNNYAIQYGGALYRGNAINCSFDSNNASGSSTSHGGAIYNGSATDCNFTNNYAEYQGGAIATGNATNCKFISNTAYTGGATSFVDVKDSYFINNTATYVGGGMYGQGKTAKNSTFVLNFASNKGDEDICYINADENCTFIIPEFVANNTTLPSNTESKLNFNLSDNGVNYDGYNTTVKIYRDDEIIATYSSLTGSGAKLILPKGIYKAELSLNNSNVKPVNVTINVDIAPTIITVENLTVRFNSDETLNITLTDSNDFPIVGVNITVELNGTSNNYLTNDAGIAEIPIINLKPNTYTAKISFEGNENYMASNTTEEVVIEKLTPFIIIEVREDIIAHQENRAHFTLADYYGMVPDEEIVITVKDEFGNVIVNGEKWITDVEGNTQVIFYPVTNGKLNITATFDGNPEVGIYNAVEESISVEVKDIGTIIELDVENTTVNGKPTITVYIKDANGNAVNGTFELSFNDTSETVTYALNRDRTLALIKFNNTDISKYVNVTARFIPTENSGYASSTTNNEFFVDKIDTILEIKLENLTAHQENIATVTLKDIYGNVISGQAVQISIASLDDNYYMDENITDENGQISVVFTPITKSNIVMGAYFNGTDDKFNSTMKETSSKVANMKTVINVSANNTVINETTDIVINIADMNNNPISKGYISVSFDDGSPDKIISLDGNATEYTFTFNKTDVKKTVVYDATFYPEENSGYEESSANSEFEVEKIETIIHTEDLVTIINTEDYLVISLKDGKETPLSGFEVTVELDGNTSYTTYENGEIKVPTKDLAAGTYTANISYAGNDNYKNSSASAQITVNKIETELTAEDVTTTYDVAKDLVVTLKDNEGNPLSNVEVTVELDGNTTYTTDANGQIKVAVEKLVPNTYTAKISYAGNDTHKESSTTATVTVNKIETELTAEDVTTTYNVANDMTVTLKDNEGNPLSGVELTVELDSNTTYTTDANGQIKVPTKDLAAGTYTANINFAGNDTHKESSTTATVTVNKVDTSITAEDVTTTYDVAKDLVVSLKDKQGNPISGIEVTVELDGNTKYTTDKNGQIKVPVEKLVPNTYTAKISFAGNDNYTESSTTATVTVNKIKINLTAANVTTTYDVAKDLVVTLKDQQGNPISGVSLTVNLGSDKNYTTDSNGQVKVAVGILVPKTYTAKISYAGSKIYESASTSAKVVVNKATPKMALKDKTYKYELKTKQFAVILKNNKNQVMKNTKLTLKVGGQTYTAKTDSQGKAIFKITKLNKKGQYTAVITYAGSRYYNKLVKKAKITVKALAWQTIAYGSKKHAIVKQIQRALKNNGYYLKFNDHYLKIDGIFHRYTRMAVMEFQAANNLKVTGKVDYATAKKLKIVA